MKLYKFLCTSMMSLVLTLTACAPNISPDVVESDNANTVTKTVHGTIVSIQVVKVKRSENTVGTLAGAGIGGVAGSAIGGGDRVPIIGAIGGAVLGGLGGNYAQNKLSTQEGVQYIVKTDSGNLITVVQGAGTQTFHRGQSVYVVEGEHAHIISAQ